MISCISVTNRECWPSGLDCLSGKQIQGCGKLNNRALSLQDRNYIR